MERVTVLGSGTMGSGIAQNCMTAGMTTTLFDVEASLLTKARDRIFSQLTRQVEKGRMDAQEAEAAKGRLTLCEVFQDAVATCDFLIEAIPEKLELKRSTFARAASHAPEHCILGTNTSTLMISAIGEGLDASDRLIGVHFFNPVPVMKLLEIVMGSATSEATYGKALELAARLGKEPVRVKESPGFTTSRINALIGNEAFRMLDEGVASASDIDKALKLGLNHPMGPFEMVDLVGLDARLNNTRALFEALAMEAYRPSPLLERLVGEGRLGRKSGRGVYRYDADGKLVPGSDQL